MTSLARQLADHERWEWQPGMHYRFNGRRYLYTGRSSIGGMDAGCAPDLDDPATKGWLLAMLREAWGDRANPDLCARWDHGSEDEGPFWYAASGAPETTEGEALARALLAAWGEL